MYIYTLITILIKKYRETTSLSIPGSPPASISNIFQEGYKFVKWLAIKEPAVPAPTIIKSYDATNNNINV